MTRIIPACILLIAMAAGAQQAPVPTSPQYDLVAAVKPSRPGDSHLRIRMNFEVIEIQNASLKDLLSNTYGMRGSLLLNLPKWAESDHFDVQAKLLSDDANFVQHITRAQRTQIFERLLAEQFGVVSHKETRIFPIYELKLTGPGPQRIENPPPPPSDEPEALKPGHNGRGSTSVNGTHLDTTGTRIADLCANLARILDRTVVDKTGLTSFYDMTFTWSDETSAEATGPSLFTAIQEQLGLKLQPAKGPVEVLVVDRASPPRLDEPR